MRKLFRYWRIIYAVFCLAYMGWVIHAGGNEFNRINSQYKRLVAQLDGDRIRSVALEELTAECLRQERERLDQKKKDDCSTWAPTVVESKEKQVKERVIRAKERGVIKVVLFYMGFVLIFLLAPPILFYLLIVGIIKIFKSVKFVSQ